MEESVKYELVQVEVFDMTVGKRAEIVTMVAIAVRLGSAMQKLKTAVPWVEWRTPKGMSSDP